MHRLCNHWHYSLKRGRRNRIVRSTKVQWFVIVYMYRFTKAVCCTIAMDNVHGLREREIVKKIMNKHTHTHTHMNKIEHEIIRNVKMFSHQHFYCFIMISKPVMDSIFCFPPRTDWDRLPWHWICVFDDLHLFHVRVSANDNPTNAIRYMYNTTASGMW